jgi:hypothetical protein
VRRIEDLLYKPRHSSERNSVGRKLVVVRGRTFEKLTFVRAGLVLLGLTIAGLAWLVPNPDKPIQGSTPSHTRAKPTGAKPTGPRQTGIVTTPASHHGAGALKAAPPTTYGPGARTTTSRPANRGSTPPIAASSPLTESSPARNLPTPPGLGPELRNAWILANPGGSGLTSADVRSTAPGSVYFASQPAISMYWAIARFVPTPAVHGALLRQFNAVAAFEKAAGSSWSFLGDSIGPCNARLPAPVLTTWGLCKSPGS